MLHILPVDPQREAHHAGQFELVHIIHVAVHWLLIPVEAALGLWLIGLIIALLGWTVWAACWLVRRATAARRDRHARRLGGAATREKL
ncbi:hypothetical protein [Lichenicoccus sp.]|uniref:hypothetical protein n=1 Tax=Lichenicoccus sp. TaxID=2781899 RepID=UPI003D09D54D